MSQDSQSLEGVASTVNTRMRLYDLSKSTVERFQWRDPHLRHLTEILVRLAEPANGRALDVGCGTGRISVALAEKGFRVDALDPEVDVVEHARELASQLGVDVNFLAADFTKPDHRFPDKRYDLVVCCEVLEHVAEWEKVVTNMRRVLKPGGVLILTVPNGPRQFNVLDTYSGHLRRYKWEQLAAVLQGFDVEKRFTIGFPFLRALRWIYVKFAIPLIYKKPATDRMWRPGSIYERFGVQAIYRLAPLEDLFNGFKWGTTWVVKARKTLEGDCSTPSPNTAYLSNRAEGA